MSKRIENTIYRSEEWQQKEGEGILEIRGGELDIVLIVNGVPQVFDALDCGEVLVVLWFFSTIIIAWKPINPLWRPLPRI